MLLFVAIAVFIERQNAPTDEITMSHRADPATSVHDSKTAETHSGMTSGSTDATTVASTGSLYRTRGVYNPRARYAQRAQEESETTATSTAQWVKVPGSAVALFPRPTS